MAAIWVLESILLGCLLAWRWCGLPAMEPRFARLLTMMGAGTAGGIGVGSCLYFLFGVLLGRVDVAMGAELAVLVWAGYEAYRKRIPLLGRGGPKPPGLAWVLMAVLLVTLGIATAAMATAWSANPQGNWDAWSIWNLRARFLAAGDGLAQRAWSPVLSATTHSEYPLLVSAFTGRCWALGKSFSMEAPAAAGYALFLATIAMVGGGVTVLRGPLVGGLSALVLAATPSLIHEVPAQYADIPLACYLAGAVVFALLDRPAVAGVFAGFAAWTKDEGLLFLVLFLAALAVFRRRRAIPAIAGMLPMGLLLAIFKLILARDSGSLLTASLPGAVARLTDVGRYGTIVAAFGREFAGMGAGWYHPVLPLIAVAVALRFDRERLRDAAFAGGMGAGLLAGYFGIYAITANDLAWHLQTSLGRLLVQLWPVLVVAAMVGLRTPVAPAVEAAEVKGSRTMRRSRR